MPISSLPDICFNNVFSNLDGKTLYKCLFVNRYFCKITIPLIWREPLNWYRTKISLINTLLACLNEDEISSLIPYAINFHNNQFPLFEYGKFIKIFNHGSCVQRIIEWLGLSHSDDRDQDYRTQKLVNVIYHMMMRQGSNLQEFTIRGWGDIDLPKISTFTTYEPGITNLRSLKISFDKKVCENTIKFLNMVPKSCNGIVDCDLQLTSPFFESFVDIIKSQPLERILLSLYSCGIQGIQVEDKKVIFALEFRSETLKELTLENFDFQDIDLSFMSKLDRLERLCLINCIHFLFIKKLRLKELKLEYYKDNGYDDNELKMRINPLLNEELYKLELVGIITPEMTKVIGESCPKIKFLQININPNIFLNSAILPFCELTSLKTLTIECDNAIHSGPLVEMLGDSLKFVEFLSLDFDINLSSFEYFTVNCKADLKKLMIYIDPYEISGKDYLIHVSNYQKVHNSLNLFRIIVVNKFVTITNEEWEIIDLLENQGVDVEYFSGIIK